MTEKELMLALETALPYINLKNAIERFKIVGENKSWLDSIKLGKYDYCIEGLSKDGTLSLTRYYGECVNCPYHDGNGGKCDIDSERFRHDDAPCMTEFDLGNYSETYDFTEDEIDDFDEFTEVEKQLIKFLFDTLK